MDIPYVECKDGEATQKTMPLEVRVGSVSQSQKDALAKSAQLALKACNNQDLAVYAAVPEWWQIRPEGKRPQLVLQFCAKLSSGKYGPPMYSVTIPHPINTEKLLFAPIDNYKKGNFEGELKLADNSKIIVNCGSRAEAERVLSIFKNLVRSEMLQGSTSKFSERNGNSIISQQVYCRIATYFKDGMKGASDFTWKAKFNLP